MSLVLDQKEDLRLRMADLEKKLSESEEERCKLEKTCNVLMRAFKEEEKMRYKALNKKYEKFLEDCTVRKRRNDIILRTLSRIEDRSKILFAKTERLKLLKDRYISYLKVNDVRKDVFQPWKSFPLGSQKINDVASKLIQWKTPLANYDKREEVDVRWSLFPTSGSFHPRSTTSAEVDPVHVWREKPEEVQLFESRINEKKGLGYSSHGEEVPRTDARDGLNAGSSGLQERATNVGSADLESYQTKADSSLSEIRNRHQDVSNAAALKEREVISRHETPKRTLTPEEESLDNDSHSRDDIIEKDNTEQNEKPNQNRPHNDLIPVINHNLAISPPIDTNDRHETDEKNNETKSESPDFEEERQDLPMGLDGVDYENETYPESYYEQPAPPSHVSIASDVILEEDETEQEEGDEARPEEFGSNRSGSPQRGTCNEPERKSTEEHKHTDEEGKGRADEGVTDLESESERGGEPKPTGSGEGEAKTDRSGGVVPGKPNKSNLIHLLESDSESFQIEHGDAVSGNDDSEFDFSFGQN